MTEAELKAIKARCEAGVELIDELHTERLEYPEYLTLRTSIDDIPALLDEIDRLKAERDAALTEVCRRCPDGEVIDGIKHYPCNGCKWRGVQEKEEVK